MKTKLNITSLAILFLFACATPPDFQTTMEPGADPGKYRTFAFVQSDAKDAGAITDSLAQRRLQQMVARQLVGKGYVAAAPGQRADLGVNVAGHVVPKQRVFMVGSPTPYDYNWGQIEPGGTQTVDYRQGTLYVDLVDLGQSRLLWRARISEALTPGYSEENWQKVERAVGEAFKSLPAHR